MISDRKPFLSVSPDGSGLILEGDTRSALLAERQQDERIDCDDGANEVVILVVVLFVAAVMPYDSSLWKFIVNSACVGLNY